jgi:hypothetical protein
LFGVLDIRLGIIKPSRYPRLENVDQVTTR